MPQSVERLLPEVMRYMLWGKRTNRKRLSLTVQGRKTEDEAMHSRPFIGRLDRIPLDPQEG